VAEIIALAEEARCQIGAPSSHHGRPRQWRNHQNTILRVGEYPYADLEDVLEIARERQEKPLLLLFDLLKDPQNVGVLLRVADAVGVHGVILQERRAVSVTPAVVSASSGAVEHLNVVQVPNLVQTMKELRNMMCGWSGWTSTRTCRRWARRT
jgi:23S rRNA (guanosine2251-2'-O)-methyltransferase